MREEERYGRGTDFCASLKGGVGSGGGATVVNAVPPSQSSIMPTVFGSQSCARNRANRSGTFG